MSDFANDFAKYICLMEGFQRPGTPAWRNNNPGNLDGGVRERSKDTQGRGVYARVSDGWADLEDLIKHVIVKHQGLTLETFFAGERDAAGHVLAGGYAGFAPVADPRGKNSPVNYALFLASGLRLTLKDPLFEYLEGSSANANP